MSEIPLHNEVTGVLRRTADNEVTGVLRRNLTAAQTQDQQDLIWTVIEDVKNSYSLAMQGAGLSEEVADEITKTVEDYTANQWGDD